MFTMIPQDTFESLQLEAGVLLQTFDPENPGATTPDDVICPTTGGITVSCVPTYSDMGADVDNAPVNVKELMHLDSWAATMAFTALSTKPEFIKMALGAADIDASNSGKVIPRRDLSQGDFQEVWWAGDRADGGWAAVRLMNALSTGGFSLKTTKSGKGQVSVTLTGHVSINAQDVVPMEFYSGDPDDAAGGEDAGGEEVSP